MPVTIKKRFKTLEALKNTRKVFNPLVEQFIVPLLKEIIRKGLSPVQGEGRFKKYSKSYLKAIEGSQGDFKSKKKSPVNLTLSGDMLKETKVKKTENGLILSIDHWLADIHNRQGAGKSKVIRRLLPTESGETFTREITKRLREALLQAVKIITRR